MLILRTVMPRRWIQRQRPFWPCHLAFQLGRRRTAGPAPERLPRERVETVSRAGKSWAWTVLFSGQGDSMELVKVRTFWESRRYSVAGEAAYHSLLDSMARRAYSRTKAPGWGSSGKPPMCLRPQW